MQRSVCFLSKNQRGMIWFLVKIKNGHNYGREVVEIWKYSESYKFFFLNLFVKSANYDNSQRYRDGLSYVRKSMIKTFM